MDELGKKTLQNQLIKLGDMIGDGLHYENPWISKEYRKIAKILYPEMYPKKKRKPNQKFIRSLCKCDCGANEWKYVVTSNNLIEIKCSSCNKTSGRCTSNTEARNKWNSLFSEKN